MNITQRDDGRFEVGDRIFPTEGEAKAFADGASTAFAGTTAKKVKPAPVWLQAVVGLGGAYLMFSCVSGIGSNGKSAASIGLSDVGALTLCQSALEKASLDPATAEVPYVPNHGTGGEFYFAWGASTKPVRMKNGFGALLAAGASCTVNKQTGKITSLTLNGKSVM